MTRKNMKQQTKGQSNQDTSTPQEEKNFFQILQEMPFSKDKIGESFIRRSKKR